jgi:hypothetical protein
LNLPDASDANPSLVRRSSQNDLLALVDPPEKKVNAHGYQTPVTGKVSKPLLAHGEARSLEGSRDLYYLSDLKDRSDMKPPMPHLTKVACSSLSDFFCKPLFPEAILKSREILRIAQQKHDIFKDSFVIQAFKEADQAHSGQVRYLVVREIELTG